MRYRIRAMIEFDAMSRAEALEIQDAIEITHPDLELDYTLKDPEWMPPPVERRKYYAVRSFDGQDLTVCAESAFDAADTALRSWAARGRPTLVLNVENASAPLCSICRREHGPDVVHASE